jgi:hypothetical protein
MRSTWAPPSSSPTSSPTSSPIPPSQHPTTLAAALEHRYGLLGPHLPPLLSPLIPPLLSLHDSAHSLCCSSHTLQVCITNIYTVLLGPYLPPLLPRLLPPHHSAHHLCCRSHTIQVCIKNIYMVYSGPSLLLSSLPITVLTTCAAALILFRSALRTYIWSTRAPAYSSPPSPSQCSPPVLLLSYYSGLH